MRGLLLKNNPKEMGKIAFFALVLVSFACVLFFLPRLSHPVGIAYVCFLVTNPIVKKLVRLKLSRTLAVIIVFLVLALLAIAPLFYFFPILTDEFKILQNYIPEAQTHLLQKYEVFRGEVSTRFNIDIGDKLVSDVVPYVTEATKNFLLKTPQYLASFLEWIFIIPIFVFFFLKDGRQFKFLVLRSVPNTSFERIYYLFYQFNKQLGDYILAKVIEALIVGVLITAGLLAAGVKFSFLLGFIAGITNIIPYLGPILGAVPGLIYIAIEYGPGSTLAAATMIYALANFIDIALVFPVLVSKIVDLHPVVVVVSVILGSQFFGVVGMVVSIPIAAAIKLICLEVYEEFYSPDSK